MQNTGALLGARDKMNERIVLKEWSGRLYECDDFLKLRKNDFARQAP